MRLRDEVESAIRSWDAYERRRGSTPVIDYDCSPSEEAVDPAKSRLEVLQRLSSLTGTPETDTRVTARLTSDIAYLRALLGERAPLPDYIRQTQGCRLERWSADYLSLRAELAREAASRIGIAWGPNTLAAFADQEGRLSPEQAPDAIRRAAAELEPIVRKLSDSDAPFDLNIESTEVDAYWAYWLDGRGPNARLRLNLRRAQFTTVQARVFALHEVLGHALKGASYAMRCAESDVPWVRLLSVHAPQQVLMEGLAQALPMFVVPDDDQAVARTRLAHFTQLVMGELHLAVNEGAPIEQCVRFAKSQVPFWTDEAIGDILHDRSVNPQLRSYLWSYAAGIDWFVNLAERGGEACGEVLKAAYREPLTPTDLEAFWPEGPKVGGGL